MKKINNSPSQACQDSFVMNMLDFKREGFYLEIGASDYYTLSNTYILENDYGWSGVSLEIDSGLAERFNSNRKNKCLNLNAITADYNEILSSMDAPKQIDYLQVDIDPAPNTLAALKAVPLDKYRFSVITFEHDIYANAEYLLVQIQANEILESYGYQRVIKNLWSQGNPFEDWYVDPNVVKENIWRPVSGENLSKENIFV
jgi:hypothetical protein